MLFWSSADALNTIDPEASPGAAGVTALISSVRLVPGGSERIGRHFATKRYAEVASVQVRIRGSMGATAGAAEDQRIRRDNQIWALIPLRVRSLLPRGFEDHSFPNGSRITDGSRRGPFCFRRGEGERTKTALSLRLQASAEEVALRFAASEGERRTEMTLRRLVPLAAQLELSERSPVERI